MFAETIKQYFKEKLQPLYVKPLLKQTSDSEILTTLLAKYKMLLASCVLL